MNDYVYFIEAEGMVKIGVSYKPLLRLQQIQPCSPVELALTRVETGSGAREHELHQMFERERSHFEWYRVSRRLRRYIDGPGNLLDTL